MRHRNLANTIWPLLLAAVGSFIAGCTTYPPEAYGKNDVPRECTTEGMTGTRIEADDCPRPGDDEATLKAKAEKRARARDIDDIDYGRRLDSGQSYVKQATDPQQ